MLRNEARLAALLLFLPWIATFLLQIPLFRQRPVAILALLPGLAAALHVQYQLIGHLGTNRRLGEEQLLFPTLGPANWLTVLRAGAIVLLGGMLPLAVVPGEGLAEALSWAPGLLYLGIVLADLLDGWLARRLGRQTELGKRLDIVSDAAGLLVASLVAVGLGRLPAAYLLVGLAYYPFIFGIWWRQQRGLALLALPPRPYGRIIAGMQMGLVGLALLPLLQPLFTHIAAYLFMIPLLAGFIRDWLVVSCRLASDSAWEERIGDLLKGKFPLVLRMIILGCGLAMLAGDGGGRISIIWQLAFGLSCLLAALAVMGRSAALILALVLAGNSSPFGTSIIAMVLFGAAVGLILTGTGAFSLWSPEERILYRRDGKDRADRGKTSVVRSVFDGGWRWLLLILALVLAWYALRGVAWAEAWGFLARLGPVAILILVAVNLLMLPVMAGRWWLLVRAGGPPVGLVAVSAYRCAANAVSYLTPGPHFGGEPLAVFLLHRRQGIALSAATTSVVVDRLLELAASLVVFTLCLMVLTLPGGGPFPASRGPALAWSALALVVALLIALFTGKRPVSRLISLAGRFARLGPAAETLRRCEEMAETLFRRRRLFLLVNLCSVCQWLGVFGEFWLMSYFLGFPLSLGQLTAVVLTARLAFLTPLPAGIGVLETALPWLTAALGQGEALGLSLCLVIRFRDLLFSLSGLVLTLKYLTCREKTGIISNIWG